LRGLRWNLEKFAEARGKDNSVHQMQRHDVESWVNAQSFSLKTRANYLRDLGILFNFAATRRWTAENPCAFIEKPSELDREVSALKPAEVSKLLAACPDAFLPGVCLKLFAGLRTSELLSLDWSEVSASEIVVRGAKAKTRQRRVVAIAENLAAWLQPFRKPSGRLAPFLQNAWHRSLEAIAESAGLRLPSNVLRHSFGSYHFAQHRNENLTAAEMGNSPTMIYPPIVRPRQQQSKMQDCKSAGLCLQWFESTPAHYSVEPHRIKVRGRVSRGFGNIPSCRQMNRNAPKCGFYWQ
jgi:integrase